MLLRGETSFFVSSLRYDSVLMFNFSDINRGYNRGYGFVQSCNGRGSCFECELFR